MTSNSRPAFSEIWMRLAHDIARRSTCKRLSVGVVVASEDNRRVYAIGYNGSPAGMPHDCSGEPSVCGCSHAEMAASASCTTQREAPKIVYQTHSPCRLCASIWLHLGGVTKLYYASEYRSRDGLDLLERAGINTIQKELA